MSLIIGIDPGFSGAIAMYDPDTGWLEIHDMPVYPVGTGRNEINHTGVLDVLKSVSGATVWIERVSAMPNQGAPSTFRFGQGYGALEMGVAACGYPINYVTPAKWKAKFRLSGGKKAKGVSRSYASQQFPKYADLFKRVKDDGRAEAALIALYGASITHGKRI